jgi:hypothetical protein
VTSPSLPSSGGRRLDVHQLLRRRRDKTRRYLRPGVTLEALFEEFNRKGVRYAVLRWFETLPSVAPGEDVDILVADEDMPHLRPFLRAYHVPPRTQKFDVYSVSGLPGSDFLTVPYLPADFATGLLDRSVLLHGRYRVPGDQDHFDSLAYHAVYHKGGRSGLPENAAVEPAAVEAEHDYAEALGILAERLGLSVSLTLEGLDGYLADRGLRPPLDTLDKLSATNPWLRARLEKLWGPIDAGMPGLAVFVLRERAEHLLGRLCTELAREGFEPLETVHLSGDLARRVSTGVRGGNWGQGPWPLGGGEPVAYVVAYDLSRSVGEEALPANPLRVSDSKLAIRERLLAGYDDAARFNPLHSSDDPRQALDYLALLDDPGIVTRLRRRIAEIREQMAFPHPVVQILPSLQRRAVTAVVRHPEHGECVCKLFYPGSTRFLERELRARTEFAGLPEMPALLEAGPNYLLTPRYRDTGAHIRRTLPGMRHVQLTPRTSAAMGRLVRDLHERGAYLLDLSTQNLLTDEVDGLKVIDWEFLQDFSGDRPPIDRSPTILGRVDGEPAADLPVGGTSSDGRGTLFRALFIGVPAPLLVRLPPRVLPYLAEPGLVVLYGARSVLRAARMSATSARSGVKNSAKAGLNVLLARPRRR